jgi:pimeloyl-ACP methyl ester carboxylesterase
MVRAQAADASKRLGNLIFNPGGPGSAASQFVEEAAGVFTAGVLEHFDIIGLDPRGVGLSSRIQCDPDIFNERVSVFPSDQASFTKMVKKQRALGESCLSLTGPLLGHIDSVSVARDVEAVREALGDEKLNFLGLSYGSLLGATYAEL